MPIGLLITFLIFIRDLFAVIMWPNEYSMKPRDSKGMEEESVVNMPIKLEQMIWPFFSLSHLWFYINNSETITTLDFLPHKFWFGEYEELEVPKLMSHADIKVQEFLTIGSLLWIMASLRLLPEDC